VYTYFFWLFFEFCFEVALFFGVCLVEVVDVEELFHVGCGGF